MTWKEFKERIEAVGVKDADKFSLAIHGRDNPFQYFDVQEIRAVEVCNFPSGKIVSIFPAKNCEQCSGNGWYPGRGWDEDGTEIPTQEQCEDCGGTGFEKPLRQTP